MNLEKQKLAPGIHLVAVPIGTARDITLRALDILASADVLAAEDTRSLRRLMDIHGVPLGGRPLVALHDHSRESVIDALLRDTAEGKSVAYASEAGMPLIADPGFELVRAAREAGCPVTCAPGPSAALTALALGGLPTDAFHFAGFLPNARTARQKKLAELSGIAATLIFYESPKRLAAMLEDAREVLGEARAAAVCRELTKKFEEVRRGTLAELSGVYAAQKTKGEIVVLIDRGQVEKASEADLREALVQSLGTHSMRDAVDMVAQVHDMPRREVYQLALAISRE